MAKFRYRMQNILNIKEKLESAAKMEFMAATAKVNEEEEQLEKLKKRAEALEDEGRSMRKKDIHIMDLRHNAEAISTMQELLKEQRQRLEEAKALQREKRQELQTAMQERKTQDKLYENALEMFKQEENARESKEVDELVSYVYGQRSKEQGEN